ncbi:MAG: hypothetical protein IJM62_07040 [Lachnospiraceae bacterium]|nr:hypothetical protein [Lachnospiraceae bacterium]
MAGTLTIRVNDAEDNILAEASAVYGVSKSTLIKRLAFEKLEDEFDLQAIAEYEKKKAEGSITTRPVEELWEELGI